MNPVILIEFNELCPSLLDRWMAEGKLPNFKKFHENSDVFVTEADEKEAPNLEPWIQWYSLHTGVPFRDHQVFHLTDGPRATQRDIWQRLLDKNKVVWNCSSMNTKGLAHERSVFLPDPWCTSETPFPAELKDFHRFVASQVQEYSNADRGLQLGDVLRFLGFMVGHGLRAKTVMAILRQLLSERRNGGESAWRRATILDKLLFDVFRHYQLTRRPDFSTFFANSTAHLQHSYWRCMDPDAFTVKPGGEDIRKHGDAVLFGYQEMDRLLGDFFQLEEECGATLVFATALSQQPFLKYEATGGQHFYRPRRVEDLLKSLGLAWTELAPVMTHQYVMHFANAAMRNVAEQRLRAVTVDGVEVFRIEPTNTETSLYFGCKLNQKIASDAQLNLGVGQSATPFFGVFYRIEEIKSGRHHPDGCFWVKSGRHTQHPQKVSILDIAPTLLGMLQVDEADLSGRNLLRA
ncbi:hypothetical protein [Rhodoferax sp. GW822-FHT02A01]|uniref:hypothetical protein n=1 Tax=Rhodoferax sp. GW822-FHT02A01 TaxID=3141537 RepID=UPI00315D2252